jgi:hypothetical protein
MLQVPARCRLRQNTANDFGLGGNQRHPHHNHFIVPNDRFCAPWNPKFRQQMTSTAVRAESFVPTPLNGSIRTTPNPVTTVSSGASEERTLSLQKKGLLKSEKARTFQKKMRAFNFFSYQQSTNAIRAY